MGKVMPEGSFAAPKFSRQTRQTNRRRREGEKTWQQKEWHMQSNGGRKHQVCLGAGGSADVGRLRTGARGNQTVRRRVTSKVWTFPGK